MKKEEMNEDLKKKNKELCRACMRGDAETVKRCLDEGADINANRGDPLMMACSCNKPEIVRILLERGCKKYVRGGQFLFVPCASGYLEVVQALTDAGVNLRIQEDKALLASYESKNPKLVHYLLEQGLSIDAYPHSALMYACETGDYEMAEYQVREHQAHLVEQKLRPELLIKLGGENIDRESYRSSDQAANLACSSGHLDILKLMVDHGMIPGGDILGIAAEKGHIEIVRYLVEECQFPVNPGKEYGNYMPPIVYACRGGNMEIIRYLLSRGADLASVADLARDQAGYEGRFEVIEFLEKNYRMNDEKYVAEKEKMRIMNISMKLADVCHSGDIEQLRTLLDEGANAAYEMGVLYTPIVNACNIHTKATPEILELLISHGADIHCMEDEAICRAAAAQRPDLIQWLVDHGADVHAQKEMPITNALCFMKDSEETVRLLIKLGTDIHYRKETPVRRIVRYGYQADTKHLFDLLQSLDVDLHVNKDELLRKFTNKGNREAVEYLSNLDT